MILMLDVLRLVAGLAVLYIIAMLFDKPARKLLKKVVSCHPVKVRVLRYYTRRAEKKFKGKGRGAEKKAWVKNRVEHWGMKADEVVDILIDCIVEAANLKKSALKYEAKDKVNEAVSDVTDSVIGRR